MTQTTKTVLLIAKQIFEAEKPADRTWNRIFDAPREGNKPLSESERESFYRRARNMLGRTRAKPGDGRPTSA